MTNEIKVGIYRNYDSPDLRRQTPGGSAQWGNARFLIDKITEPVDLLVVLNYFNDEVEIECGEVWSINQEPPIEGFPWIFEGHNEYAKVFSPSCNASSQDRCFPSHGALPWHVDMTYDELKGLLPANKEKALSWITTNKTIFEGHKARMGFLDRLKESSVEFDLFGFGFTPLEDKYDGLAKYKYSLAIENFSGPDYWTEKIADCFLSWTMPIYYGCTNIGEYFPDDSFVQIDVGDPDVFARIEETVKSDLYIKNRDAIEEARRLVLDNHQLFPFIQRKLEEAPLSVTTIEKRRFAPYKESFKSLIMRKLK
jgi:hypothetical protein